MFIGQAPADPGRLMHPSPHARLAQDGEMVVAQGMDGGPWRPARLREEQRRRLAAQGAEQAIPYRLHGSTVEHMSYDWPGMFC